MKIIQRIKKIATSIMPILVVFLSGAVWMQAVCLREDLSNIETQMQYLIENDVIMQMQMSDITYYMDLMEEGKDSLIEEQSIRVVDVNFATGKYQVEISVIPREYSDTTKVSVFFGVSEVPLTFKQYSYEGSTVLSLREDYDGNVTYLFADGDKKRTEIITEHEDLNTQMQDLLWGEMINEPVFENGNIRFDSEICYVLNKLDNYEFKTVELLLWIGDKKYTVKEIFSSDSANNRAYETTETFYIAGTYPIKEGEKVSLYLYAECENGLVVERELFVGTLDEKLLPIASEYRVYDESGNKWK